MADSMLDQLKNVCRNHRSKGYYIARDQGLHYLPDPSKDCWCLMTQGPVGPDDRFVSSGECLPGRSCFRCRIPC